MMLTFDWSWGKVSKEADCHFQDVGFLQLGVTRVAFSNQRQNQTFQVSKAVVDTSTSSLLQQRFESLTEGREFGYWATLFTESHKKKKNCISIRLLTFLSSLACFLWATVDFAGRDWLASAMTLGLISFCCLLCFLEGGTDAWSGRARVYRRVGEPPIYVSSARQKGGDTSHEIGGGDTAERGATFGK